MLKFTAPTKLASPNPVQNQMVAPLRANWSLENAAPCYDVQPVLLGGPSVYCWRPGL